jgi:hypothetical protein
MAKSKDKDSIKDVVESNEDVEIIQNSEPSSEPVVTEADSSIEDEPVVTDEPAEKKYPAALKILKDFKCQVSTRPNNNILLVFKENQIINDEHKIKILIDNNCAVVEV